MSATPSVTRVSTLLPAWNEEGSIGACLDSLLAVPDPMLEILVCAGGPDKTLQIARDFAAANPGRITVLEQRPGEGKQAALRRLFPLSRGRVVYLTDADCVVPPETIGRLLEHLADGDADAVTGPAYPLADQIDDQWVRHQWATVRAVDRARPAESTGLLGRNCAVLREAVVAAGAFAADVPIGTDYHLARALLAAGRTIRFVDAPVHTHYHGSIRPYLRQQSRWLRNILLHDSQFGGSSERRGVLITVATGAGLLLWPLTWRRTGWLGVALWFVPLAWMARQRVERVRALEHEAGLVQTGSLAAALHGLRFAVLDLVTWATPLLDMATPGRRLRW